MLGITKEVKPHRNQPRSQRLRSQSMALETGFQSFPEDYSSTFPRSVQHRSRLGVMIQTQRTPVIHQHGKVEVVGLNDRTFSVDAFRASYTGLDMLAGVDPIHSGFTQSNG